MKYLVYHITTPLGYSAEIWTDGGLKGEGATYENLFANEEMRIQEIEMAGCKIQKASNLPPTPKEAPEVTTSGQEKHFCGTCGKEMTYKEGISKAGKPYKGWFCLEREHEPIWLK